MADNKKKTRQKQERLIVPVVEVVPTVEVVPVVEEEPQHTIPEYALIVFDGSNARNDAWTARYHLGREQWAGKKTSITDVHGKEWFFDKSHEFTCEPLEDGRYILRFKSKT